MSRPAQQDNATQQQVAALVAAQAAARLQVWTQATAHAQISAQQFSGWYDTNAVGNWAAQLAVAMESYQRTIAKLTDSYLARAAALVLGVPRIRPVGSVDVTALRAGVTHAGAYARAADVYRWQQSLFDKVGEALAGGTVPEKVPALESPRQAAVARVVDVADMDAQLASRAQESATLGALTDRGVIGWRRVVHPEMSKGGACGLCIAAAERVYGPTEPRPLHAGCHCTTLPVSEAHDPGAWLNDQDLAKHAGGNTAAKLKRTRYQVDEHGELGLVLQPAGVKARTARDAARAERAAPARSAAEIHDLMRARHAKLTAALPKLRDLAEQAPGTWQPYVDNLEPRVHDLARQLAA